MTINIIVQWWYHCNEAHLKAQAQHNRFQEIPIHSIISLHPIPILPNIAFRSEWIIHYKISYTLLLNKYMAKSHHKYLIGHQLQISFVAPPPLAVRWINPLEKVVIITPLWKMIWKAKHKPSFNISSSISRSQVEDHLYWGKHLATLFLRQSI